MQQPLGRGKLSSGKYWKDGSEGKLERYELVNVSRRVKRRFSTFLRIINFTSNFGQERLQKRRRISSNPRQFNYPIRKKKIGTFCLEEIFKPPCNYEK